MLPRRASLGETPRWLQGTAVAGLLALFAVLGVHSMLQKNATYDEVAHLPAGFTHLVLHDYRVNPEHPPLAKALAAIPVWLAGARAPAETFDPWKQALRYPGARWLYGHAFLYATPGNDADTLVNLGRVPMLLLALLLGLVVWRWSWRLHGGAVALWVLGLFCLEPNLLAHGRLITTDVPLTLWSTVSLYFLWRAAEELSAPRVLAASLAFAAALSTKYSAVLLLVFAVLCLLVRALGPATWSWRWRRRRGALGTRARRLAAAGCVLLLGGLVCWGGIWASYGFRYGPTADPEAHLPVESTVRVARAKAEEGRWQAGLVAATVDGATRHHLIPEAWAFGFLYSTLKAQRRSSYLRGTISTEGSWTYFPIAIGVKTPLPLLILALLGLGTLGLTWRRGGAPAVAARRFALFGLLPALLYLALAMASALNIGLRHVLPIYPALILLAGYGVAALWRARGPLARVLLACLFLWQGAGTLGVHPDYLAYFNEVAGGPEGGSAWLVDSNLDWGQDLAGLARWMRAHDVPGINLSYFGTADPRYYGIKGPLLPTSTPYPLRPQRARLPGLVAISATYLAGVGLEPEIRAGYARLLEGAREVTTIGHSILVFAVDHDVEKLWPSLERR